MLAADEQQWLPGTFHNGTFTFYAAWTDVPGGGITASFGTAGDKPVVGDWNGDGNAEVGVYRNNTFYLDSDADRKWSPNVDKIFRFGRAGDVPVVGAWDGSSQRDRVGIFRDGFWWLDANDDKQAGPGDVSFNFGQPGDIPVTGDWDYDGITDVGVYRQGMFLLDMNGNHRWDSGDEAIPFGKNGDTPITASNYSVLSVYRDGKFYNDRNKDREWDIGDSVITFGQAPAIPINGLFHVPRGTGKNSNAGFDLVTAKTSSGFKIVPANSSSYLPAGSSGANASDVVILPAGSSGMQWRTRNNYFWDYTIPSGSEFTTADVRAKMGTPAFSGTRYTIFIEEGGELVLPSGVKLSAGTVTYRLIILNGKWVLDPSDPPVYTPA